MFSEYTCLTDITPFKNLDVSRGESFKNIFYKCTNLTTVGVIKNLNINDGKNLSRIF